MSEDEIISLDKELWDKLIILIREWTAALKRQPDGDEYKKLIDLHTSLHGYNKVSLFVKEYNREIDEIWDKCEIASNEWSEFAKQHEFLNKKR